MPITLIPANSQKSSPLLASEKSYLHVSEFFSNTIQGEGISIGHPATFLRLQGCILDCKWCDTTEVWKNGDKYSFEEIFCLLEKNNTIDLLKENQHLVITGGSPLKQQKQLINFILEFKKKYRFIPFIEIENECVLSVEEELLNLVKQWNNSPKLFNSGMRKNVRYKPAVILQMKQVKNAWFKFVIDSENDWQEIKNDFLDSSLINKNQIILMPLASSRKNLNIIRKKVLEIAIDNNVKFSDRLHITIFDKKTGV